MSTFIPKKYQYDPVNGGGVLNSVETYFQACHELPSPSIAYTATTERLWGRGLAYNPLAGFPTDMPYFCLRVPTGGGKTWLAAKSVALVNTHLLRCEHSVVLWLVALSEKPDFKALPKAIKDKLHWEPKLNTLTLSAPLTEEETEVLKATVKSEAAVVAIAEAAEVSRTTAIEFFQTPAELGERFRIPQLALRVQGHLQLFDDPEVLDYPWDLSPFDAVPTADDLATMGASPDPSPQTYLVKQ